jgi:hypothetical protein
MSVCAPRQKHSVCKRVLSDRAARERRLREQLGHALAHLVATSEAVDQVDDVQAVDVHVNNRAEAVSGFPKPEALISS